MANSSCPPRPKPAEAASELLDAADARWLREPARPGTPAFACLNHPELLRFSRVVSYRKKDIIIREGMTTDFVCVLLNGTAIAYRTGEAGQRMLLTFFQAGKLYGFMSMFCSGVQTMTVEALEDCTNLEIDKAQLKRLLMAQPQLMWKFAEEMAEGVSNSSAIVEQRFLSAEHRIYHCLLNLSRQFGHKTAEGIELRVNLTQEDLASYAATTRVTAARIISALAGRGVLRVKPKPWLICEIEGITELLNHPRGRRS